MNLRDVIDECGVVAVGRGFDLSQTATQVALVATEVAEALDHVLLDAPLETRIFVQELRRACREFEVFRQSAENYQDLSLVTDRLKLMEELADVCIRVFSYVGGNDRTDEFLGMLLGKMRMNHHRPWRHGKGF